MPGVPWSKGPGHTAIRPQSVVISTSAWQSSPQRSRPSAGRPGPALQTVSPPDGQRQKCQSGRGRHGPRIECLDVGHCQAHGCDTRGIKTAAGRSQSAPRFSRPSEETQPRCGVTRGGVMRPLGTLVPSMRQAPDGGTSGGSQPGEWPPLCQATFSRTGSGTGRAWTAAPGCPRLSHC